MREIFKYGSVGRAPGDRCLYPEADVVPARLICSVCARHGTELVG
jgi:hypothetical protein